MSPALGAQSLNHRTTRKVQELLLMDEQRKWFHEMESTPGEDTMKIVEITAKDFEYYINSVGKAVVGFNKRIDSNFERSSTGVKCYQTALHATKKLFVKGSSQLMRQLHGCLILRNGHTHPSL